MQMFQLVADIEKYSEFLPWCVSTRVRSREGNELLADMVIGYKIFRERFTSRVTLTEPERIDVAYSHGPFKYLQNRWIFEPNSKGECIIDFHVEFEFKSKLMEKMIGLVFNEAVKKMVYSFEKRAFSVYSSENQIANTNN